VDLHDAPAFAPPLLQMVQVGGAILFEGRGWICPCWVVLKEVRPQKETQIDQP
jgi:hypothetical protein